MRLREINGALAFSINLLLMLGSAWLGIEASRDMGQSHPSWSSVSLIFGAAAIGLFAVVCIATLNLPGGRPNELPSFLRFFIAEDDLPQFFFIGVACVFAGGVGGAMNQILTGEATAWGFMVVAGAGGMVGVYVAAYVMRLWLPER